VDNIVQKYVTFLRHCLFYTEKRQDGPVKYLRVSVVMTVRSIRLSWVCEVGMEIITMNVLKNSVTKQV
jgi:hypothetical protein